jgi:hypothetical protein
MSFIKISLQIGGIRKVNDIFICANGCNCTGGLGVGSGFISWNGEIQRTYNLITLGLASTDWAFWYRRST